jgi:hypothetical protein
MGNHVHLAVRTGHEPLARVVLTVLSAYASDFNRRYGRVGHLFQGRYKAFRIGDNRHLLAVVRYIHRNPVAAGIVARAFEYPWSSDRFYRGVGRPHPVWLDTATVRGSLSTNRGESVRLYRELVDGATGEDDDPGLESHPGESSETSIHSPERPIARLPGASLPGFAAAASAAMGQPLAELCSASQRHDVTCARALTALLARNLAGIPLCRSAAYFRRDESVIARAVGRLEGRLAKDGELRGLVDRLEAEFLKS